MGGGGRGGKGREAHGSVFLVTVQCDYNVEEFAVQGVSLFQLWSVGPKHTRD